MNLVIKFNEKTVKWEIGYYYPIMSGLHITYKWYKINDFTSYYDCAEHLHYLNGGN